MWNVTAYLRHVVTKSRTIIINIYRIPQSLALLSLFQAELSVYGMATSNILKFVESSTPL